MGDIYPLLFSVTICAIITLLSFAVRGVLYTLDAPPYTDSGFKWLSPDWSLPSHHPVEVNTIFVCVYTAGTLYIILQNAFRWIIIRRMCFLMAFSQVIYFCQLGVTRFPDPNPALHNDGLVFFDMYHVLYVICFLIVQFYEYSSVIRAAYLPFTLFGLWLLIPTHMFYTIDIMTATFSVLCVFFIYHWYCRNTVAISKRRFLVWFESDALEFLLKEDEIYHRKLMALARAEAAGHGSSTNTNDGGGAANGGYGSFTIPSQGTTNAGHEEGGVAVVGPISGTSTAAVSTAAVSSPDANGNVRVTVSGTSGSVAGGNAASAAAAASSGGSRPASTAVSPATVIPSLQFFSSGTVEYAVKLEIPRHLNNPLELLRARTANNGNGDNYQLAANLVPPGTATSDESMRSSSVMSPMKSNPSLSANAEGDHSPQRQQQHQQQQPSQNKNENGGRSAAQSSGHASSPTGGSNAVNINSESHATPTNGESRGASPQFQQDHQRDDSTAAVQPRHRRSVSGSVIPEELFDPGTTLFNPYRAPSFIDHKIKADVFQRAEERLVHFVRATYSENQKMVHLWATLILGAGLGISAGLANLGAVQVTDVERPIGVPLPRDLLFEELPKVWEHTADVMVYSLLGATGALMLYRPERFTILRRTGTLYFCIMILRVFAVMATFPVDPSPLCKFRAHPPGTTCGDLIFSGHTVALLLASLVWTDYYESTRVPKWLVVGFVWCFSLTGLLMVVMSKLHYTRDVLTAAVVVIAFYHMWQVSVFLRPDVLLRHSWLRWYELDQYILLEQNGKYAAELDSSATATTTTMAVNEHGEQEIPPAQQTTSVVVQSRRGIAGIPTADAAPSIAAS